MSRSRYVLPLLTFMLSIFLISCQEDTLTESLFPNTEPAINRQYPGVDPELWSFFQRFEDEAQIRGYIVDLADYGVTAEIEEIPEVHIAGLCTYNHSNYSHITIDKSTWEIIPDIIREMIVFHELGHCYLHRDHKEAANSDGTCQSIMRSGIEGCLDNYNLQTRDSYLDELFEHAGV